MSSPLLSRVNVHISKCLPFSNVHFNAFIQNTSLFFDIGLRFNTRSHYYHLNIFFKLMVNCSEFDFISVV